MNGNGNVSIKWYATRLVCVPRILNLVLFHLVQFIIFENPTKQADKSPPPPKKNKTHTYIRKIHVSKGDHS